MILLDTHVAVWLYEGDLRRLPRRVHARLDQEALAVSPFVQLELAYMFELRRVSGHAEDVIVGLGSALGLVVIDIAASVVCAAAIALTWTRDPFDRLIAAHAIAANMPLVTRDETMRRHLPLAWWAG
ncbi:MAG TPA: PIN domain-containing protein [Chloroflexota bacterium]